MVLLKRLSSLSFASTFFLFVPLIALGIAIVSLYFAFSHRDEARLVLQADETSPEASTAILEQSRQTLERAQDAVSSAELILSFLEGASVLAGVLVISISVLGLSSLKDLRDDTENLKGDVLDRLEHAERQLIERVERAERELLSKAEQLSALEQAMKQMLDQSQARLDEQIQNATHAARRAFEALSHHVMGQRLARENNIDAAIKACQDAHELDPTSIPNNYLLGLLYLRKDELDAAIKHLTDAISLARAQDDESSAPVQAALGLALRKKGDITADVMERNRLYNLAENHLIDASASDPHLLNENKESYLGVLGSLYRRQGRIQDAIAIYRRAVQVTPRRSYPEINLAMLYLEEDDKDTAEVHRRRAEEKARRRLEDTPEDYWAKYDVGLAALLRGGVEEALTQFDEALELTPDIMTLDSVLARLYFLKNLRLELKGVDETIARFRAFQERFQSRSVSSKNLDTH